MQTRKALGSGHLCDRWISNSRRDRRYTAGHGSWRRWSGTIDRIFSPMLNVIQILLSLVCPSRIQSQTVQRSRKPTLKPSKMVLQSFQLWRRYEKLDDGGSKCQCSLWATTIPYLRMERNEYFATPKKLVYVGSSSLTYHRRKLSGSEIYVRREGTSGIYMTKT